MENKGLLFIPDISGFTRFVSQMEIEHSRLIIKELLELLINANQIGLQVSEVEGDAILFYKFGGSPDLMMIYKQVEKMFCEFHRQLNTYEYRRFCQCPACTSAKGLTLKVITHYGEFAEYNVKNFNKLIGKDLIVAHQLLKNDISQHEYWLVTKSLLNNNNPDDLTEWMKWDSSVKQTEAGEITFHYTQLSPLKSEITPEPLPQLELVQKVKMISLSKEYPIDIITLFHATGDFNYRHRWHEDVKKVEELNHFLPRVGMRCRLILEKEEVIIYASSYSFHPEKIEFTETDEKKQSSTHYLIEKIGEKGSKLTIDFYIRKNIPGEIIFNLTKKKKAKATWQKSLINLEDLVKQIKIPASSVA